MKAPKPTKRSTQVSKIIEISPHLRRIILTGHELRDFPVGQEGAYIKIVLPIEGDENKTMRSYTIRSFNAKTTELALDFVVNCHQGPATNWAKNAKVGDTLQIAGPGPLKMTNYNHHSYLLIGDMTSVNAINGYVPRFNKTADVRAVISVATRADIISMDYTSVTTEWFIEDETTITLQQKIIEVSSDMAKDTQVFMGLEAGSIRTLRPILQEEIGFDRLNVFAVGYWKKGVDADRFGLQKKSKPL